MHIIICLSKPIECTRAKGNPNVNYGLWVIMMCLSGFTDCNKCTTLVGDYDTGGYWEGRGGNIRELCVFCLFLL